MGRAGLLGRRIADVQSLPFTRIIMTEPWGSANRPAWLFAGLRGGSATLAALQIARSNHEHRAAPSDLEPRARWAMGNVGIIRELLRYVRLSEGGAAGYAVPWPDHPVTGHACPSPTA